MITDGIEGDLHIACGKHLIVAVVDTDRTQDPTGFAACLCECLDLLTCKPEIGTVFAEGLRQRLPVSRAADFSVGMTDPALQKV